MGISRGQEAVSRVAIGRGDCQRKNPCNKKFKKEALDLPESYLMGRISQQFEVLHIPN
jgi:hypothetical protein